MKNITNLVSMSVAAGTLLGVALSGPAHAGSITQPGETIGLATGAPLPEGFFIVDTANYGNSRGIGYDGNLTVNTPAFIWSTPWTILGARVELLASPPQVIVGNSQPGHEFSFSAMYNPFAEVGFAWDLGNGFGFTEYVGGYAPIDNDLNQNFWTFNNRAAVSYTANGWNLTAYTVVGITGNNGQGLKTAPDYFNYDLTATKTFGKFTIGGGAFGSTDISGISNPFYKQQSQFALAVLGGYDFTGFTFQMYLSHDVASSNYVDSNGNEVFETRLWGRIIVPVWVAPKPTVVAAKY